MTPAAEIASIDRQIDAVRRELLARAKVAPIGFIGWGNAWAKYPDLHERSAALWRQRGEAQRRRDIAAERDWQKLARSTRQAARAKCPACGQRRAA